MRAKPLSCLEFATRDGTRPMDDARLRMQRLVGRAWDEAKTPLYRNAFFIMSASVIGSALGFFFWLVVYRYFDSDDVAVAVALFQTTTFVSSLGLFGLGIGLIRFLPEEEHKVHLVNACLTIVGIASLLAAAIFIVGIDFWANKLDFILSTPLYWIAILVTSMALAFAPILDQTGYAMRRADLITWRTVIFALLKIPFALVFAAIAITNGRLGVFMALAIPMTIAVGLEGLYFLPRVLAGFRPRPTSNFEGVRPMVHFSLGNYAANAIGASAGMLLPLMILQVVTTDAVNFFYIASVVAGILGIIPGAAFTSFYAEASQKNANRHSDERRAILLSLGLLVPGIIVMWVFARFMLELFGDPKFADGAIGPLRILVFAAIPTFLNAIYGTRVRVRKQTRPLIVGTVISAAVTFGLGYPLLLSNGINGLAIAVTLAQVASVPYYYFVARRSFKGEEVPPAAPVEI